MRLICNIFRDKIDYTPDIRSMWGYIVFAFPFVHSFVRTYVRSFVRSFVFPSQGQSFCVKVYKTSYFEDPLMDFIHIWHDGRYRSKVFISTIPTPGVTLGSSRTSNFHKKVRVKGFALNFIRPQEPLMDFIHIWHNCRYRSKVFISTIPTPGVTLGSRSRTSNFHKKVRVKGFALKFIRPHILKTLWWISFIFGMMVDIGLKFLSAPSPPRGWPWGQGHGLRIFIKKSRFFVFKFIYLYHQDPLGISFIFDILLDIGLESYSAWSPLRVWPRSRSRT